MHRIDPATPDPRQSAVAVARALRRPAMPLLITKRERNRVVRYMQTPRVNYTRPLEAAVWLDEVATVDPQAWGKL